MRQLALCYWQNGIVAQRNERFMRAIIALPRWAVEKLAAASVL